MAGNPYFKSRLISSSAVNPGAQVTVMKDARFSQPLQDLISLLGFNNQVLCRSRVQCQVEVDKATLHRGLSRLLACLGRATIWGSSKGRRICTSIKAALKYERTI